MRIAPFLLAALHAASAAAIPPTAIGEETVAYRFSVGEELTYELTEKTDVLAAAEGEAEPLDQEIRVTVTPVRENADGSWRLIFRTKIRLLRLDDEGAATPRFENEVLGWCDLAPDGAYEDNPTIQGNLLFGTVPEYVFPPLPRGDGENPATAAMEWTYDLRVVDSEGTLATISGAVTSPFDRRYDNHRELTVRFDTAAGRLLELVTDSTGGDRNDHFHNRRSVELTATRRRPTQEVAAYASAAEGYFAAYEAWWRVVTTATQARTREECESLFASGRELITHAQDENREAEIEPLYEMLLSKHDSGAEDELEAASQRETLYALEPIDWRTTDLDGKAYARSDFEGRVVLLDYWYRGCSHCIEAIPAIKRVQERFADAPLTILGVNNDHDPADARHVIEAFGVNYPTVRNALSEPVEAPAAPGEAKDTLSDAYGVQGWPTFVVLDQQGRIAAIQVGNGENLEAGLTESIQRLLDR